MNAQATNATALDTDDRALATGSSSNDVTALIGRILLALIFVISGFGKIGNYAGTAQYMASKGLPMVELLLPLTILVELCGGLLLIFGWKTRWAALVIFLFLIPVSLVFHNFWAMADQARQMNMIHFMKNLAIMGGMLGLFSWGPGRLSVDRG